MNPIKVIILYHLHYYIFKNGLELLKYVNKFIQTHFIIMTLYESQIRKMILKNAFGITLVKVILEIYESMSFNEADYIELVGAIDELY